MLYFRDRLFVPDVDNIKSELMTEAHNTRYSMHPVSTKMYQNFERSILVEHVMGDCWICVSMFDLSVD